jgi:hypothetical protein
MAFTVVQPDSGSEWRDLLAAAAHFPCPRNEEWELGVDGSTAARTLVATGPRRIECGSEWTTTPAGRAHRWCHRREPTSLAHVSAEALEEMVRDLVWHPVQTAPNPIRRVDAALGRAFEAAVLIELESYREEPLVVRFSSWSGEDDGPRHLCKVECVPRGGMDARPAWRWWSPLVSHPDELAGHLRRALRARARPAALAAAATRDFWGWGAVGQAGA